MDLPRVTENKYPFEASKHVYEGIAYMKVMPKALLDDVKQYRFLPGDVMVSSYMKSGTTWCCEIVDLIRSRVDLDRANQNDLHDRVIYLESARSPHALQALQSRDPEVHKAVNIKTHLRPKFFKEQLDDGSLKVIYIYRNPKDVLVSLHEVSKLTSHVREALGIKSWNDCFELFFKEGMDGIFYGNSVDDVLAWWPYRHHKNVHLVAYEDMKRDHLGEVKRMSDFLGVELSEEQLQAIVQQTSFNKMKDNPMVNFQNVSHLKITKDHGFIRKGQIGDWKNHFSVRQNEIMDAYVAEKIKGTGIKFQYV